MPLTMKNAPRRLSQEVPSCKGKPFVVREKRATQKRGGNLSFLPTRFIPQEYGWGKVKVRAAGSTAVLSAPLQRPCVLAAGSIDPTMDRFLYALSCTVPWRAYHVVLLLTYIFIYFGTLWDEEGRMIL